MALAIHRSSPYSIRSGDKGWPAFALQRAMNGIRPDGLQLIEDMDFGAKTKSVVKVFQENMGIDADGVAGPETQQKIIESNIAVVDKDVLIPRGLLKSVAAGESGNLIAAVAWGSPGGVDCGCVQRRVYDNQFGDEAVIKRAFSTRHQLRLVGDSLETLAGIFLARPGCDNHEESFRCAALNHNYPYMADKVSRVGIEGLSSYFRTPQTWVKNIGAHFKDGVPVRTPLEWGQFYSLGSAAHKHPGIMTKFVTDWTPR